MKVGKEGVYIQGIVMDVGGLMKKRDAMCDCRADRHGPTHGQIGIKVTAQRRG